MTAIRSRLTMSVLNSLKEGAQGPSALRRNRLLSARLGWIGVMFRGWSNCDRRSSLTLAIFVSRQDRV